MRWLLALLIFATLSTATATICVIKEESWGSLRLTNFEIHADEIHLGDTVRYSFKIGNTGDDDVVLGKKGVYLRVNGKYLTHYSGGTIKPGDYLTVDSTFKVDTVGTWNVNPGVCVKFGEEENCHDFKGCSFNVITECPEGWRCMTAEDASTEFKEYVRYSDEVCGYKEQMPMYCYREVFECPESCQCVTQEEAEKNGMIPCGGIDEPKFCGYKDGKEFYCYQKEKPDLRISDVWPYESTPGVYTEIGAFVYNYGKGYASNSTVAFFVDGNYVGEVEVKGLKHNENVVVAIDYPKMCSGSQDVFEAVVDYHNVINESDETNNRYTRVYECPEGAGIPDLEVIDVWHEGEENYTCKIREYTTENGIWFKVRNSGNTTSPSTEIRLYIDGTWYSTSTVPSLDPDEEYVGSFNFSYADVCTGESDLIKVVVDPNGLITESNEGNNELEESWDCLVAPKYAVKKPDLIIRRAWLEPIGTFKWKIGYEIKNEGDEYACEFRTGLYVDNALKADDYVDRLAPGESVEKTFWWNYSMEDCTPPSDILRIYADYRGVIPETNETNNEYSLSWECTEVPTTPIQKPDLVVLQCTCSYPVFPIGRDDATVRCTIKNQGYAPAPPSTVKLSISYHEFDTERVPQLDPGESVDITFDKIWHPRTTTYFIANYTIEVFVDSDNVVDEIPYEINNIWRTYWEFPLTCNDGIQNRDEEGVDCGGSFCIRTRTNILQRCWKL